MGNRDFGNVREGAGEGEGDGLDAFAGKFKAGAVRGDDRRGEGVESGE